MIGESVRSKVLSAFSDRGEYSHVLPFRHSGYVDGMFHLSMLAGAAHLVADHEIEGLATDWILTLCGMGTNARNWRRNDAGGPEVSETGKQAFAGLAALRWARSVGCDLPEWPDAGITARHPGIIAAIAPVVLWGQQVFPGLRQHINSAMLACLVCGRRPDLPEEIERNNPFYCAIAGIRKAMPPDLPIVKPWGSAWVWKQIPVEFAEASGVVEEYTPTAVYVAAVLQEALGG